MLVASLVAFLLVLIVGGGFFAYEAYNAPLFDKDGKPVRDDDSTCGAPEGSYDWLRKREDMAP